MRRADAYKERCVGPLIHFLEPVRERSPAPREADVRHQGGAERSVRLAFFRQAGPVPGGEALPELLAESVWVGFVATEARRRPNRIGQLGPEPRPLQVKPRLQSLR